MKSLQNCGLKNNNKRWFHESDLLSGISQCHQSIIIFVFVTDVLPGAAPGSISLILNCSCSEVHLNKDIKRLRNCGLNKKRWFHDADLLIKDLTRP